MTPVDWSAVGITLFSIATGSVKWLIPGIKQLLQPPLVHQGNGSSSRTIEARMAGGEAATMLAEVRENRRGIDAANTGLDSVHALIVSLAKASERSAELLEQVATLGLKSADRWIAIGENTEAMNRMLQLHTGLLDRAVIQLVPKKRSRREGP